MTERSSPPAPRRQLIVDPRSATGFRLEDLPDLPAQSAAVFEGAELARQFAVEQEPANTEQALRRNAQRDWPPQKGPPDAAPPRTICRLDGRAPSEEPDPWGLSFPPFTEFSLCGRDTIMLFEMIMVIAGSDPHASWWGTSVDARANERLDLMKALAPWETDNLLTDIQDGKIRPLVRGRDEIKGGRDHSTDVIDINDANAFARRVGSDRWAALWAELEQAVDQDAAPEPQEVPANDNADAETPEWPDHGRCAEPAPKQRGGYIGTLRIWLSAQGLNHLHITLQRAGPSAIAKEFKLYCDRERRDVLQLLPKTRLRSLEPIILKHVSDRIDAAKSKTKDNKGQ